MKYLLNMDTKQDVFYHSSRKGIVGDIQPQYRSSDGKEVARQKTDFGIGFYIGTKEKQTIHLVSNASEPKLYTVKIPQNAITEDNSLILTKEDWLWFVLYNRGKMEGIKGTAFFEYYAHLADGKQFIIGAIADDIYNRCISDFVNNNITDYTFFHLIDCFDFGTQITAKTQNACDSLVVELERIITKEERESVILSVLDKSERTAFYVNRKAELNAEHKGLYFFELLHEIREQDLSRSQYYGELGKTAKQFANIKFPRHLHKRSDRDVEMF